MYEEFSENYDRFVNWASRLAYEMPFLEQRLQELAAGQRQPPKVLDTACGTGQHAVELARRGYPAAGADLSPAMIEKARANAASVGAAVAFSVAGFGELEPAYRGSALFPFDALLCLGNSLPHLLSEADLQAALRDFAACLRSGGMLLLQNRNFDAVLAQRERWMEPQSYREGDAEWVFLRFYDYQEDGLIQFNVITLWRDTASAPWQQTVAITHLRPLRQVELTAALEKAGFEGLTSYGDMTGAPFDPRSSGNLIVTARKRD